MSHARIIILHNIIFFPYFTFRPASTAHAPLVDRNICCPVSPSRATVNEIRIVNRDPTRGHMTRSRSRRTLRRDRAEEIDVRFVYIHRPKSDTSRKKVRDNF